MWMILCKKEQFKLASVAKKDGRREKESHGGEELSQENQLLYNYKYNTVKLD